MCGIAGVLDTTGRPVDARLLEAMCQALRHRGPDDQGTLRLPERERPGACVGLGSRRLAIIDVAGGHQPIGNEDGSVWTVLNGEIYNFATLREGLESRGHRLTTRSDTEVIVHLYEEHGEDCVALLDGMFALAVWDEPRQRLMLARDRFGKKPLHYAETPSGLAFASELQSLLLCPGIDRTLDPEALAAYLTYMAVPAPLSIYRGVRKVPPAHVLVRDTAGTRLRRYWSLPYLPKLDVSEAEAIERVREALREAVRRRLVSEVPLGALLSGGVDSSAVVALMAGLVDRPVKTFSIGFEETGFDETPHARRVAERYGCEHHEFVVRPSAAEVLPRLARHFGEPFADSSAVPTDYLARLTRGHVTVALNGDGGDEAFAGYDRHLAARLAEACGRAPAGLLRLAGRAAGALPARDSRSLPARARRFFEAAALDRPARYERWVGVITGDLRRSLLALDAPEPAVRMAPLFDESRPLDAIDAALSVDTAFYLPTDLLVKMDVATMAHSLEARSPLLDHHLVELVARLPSRMKIRGTDKKHLLKRAVADLVPARNLARPKAGFAAPIARWLRGELSEMLQDHLLSPRARQRGLLRPAAVESMVAEHLDGRRDYAHPLWVLLTLELWHRTWVDP